MLLKNCEGISDSFKGDMFDANDAMTGIKPVLFNAAVAFAQPSL